MNKLEDIVGYEKAHYLEDIYDLDRRIKAIEDTIPRLALPSDSNLLSDLLRIKLSRELELKALKAEYEAIE